MIAKDLKISEKDILSMRNDLFPVFPAALIKRRTHQAKVLGLIVGPNQEAVLIVIEMVLVLSLPRQEYVEIAVGIVRIQVPILLAQRMRGHDHKVFPGFGFKDIGAEGLIVFLKDELIRLRISAEHVTVNPIRTQGPRILLRIEEGLVVVGPSEVFGNLRDHIGQQLARSQIFKVYGKNSAPLRIHSVSE